MAPVLSKAKPRKEEDIFNHALGRACASHMQQGSKDLCELAAFVRSCLNDILDEKVEPHLVAALDAASSVLLSIEHDLRQAASWMGWSETEAAPESKPKGGTKLSDFLPMVAVGQTMGILYYSFVCFYMPAAGIALTSPESMAFHALVFMVLSSYYKAFSTDPGRVPATPEWQRPESPPSCLKETKCSGGGTARWCRRTHCYKPDRAHHSPGLEAVVLRMDHHCPYVCNTVGFANHKFFLQFLLYSSSTCVVTSLGLSWLLLFSPVPLAPSTFLLLMEADAIGILLSSILVPFTCFHCWLVAKNLTTIEYCAYAFPKPEAKSRDPSLYDLGLYRNLASVLGENPLTWLLPVGGPSGEGLTFACRPPHATIEEDLESEEEKSTTSDSNSGSSRSVVSTLASWDAWHISDANSASSAEMDLEAAPGKEPSPANAIMEAVLSSCASLQDLAQDAAVHIARLCSTEAAETRRSSVEVVSLHVPGESEVLDCNMSATAASSLGHAFL